MDCLVDSCGGAALSTQCSHVRGAAATVCRVLMRHKCIGALQLRAHPACMLKLLRALPPGVPVPRATGGVARPECIRGFRERQARCGQAARVHCRGVRGGVVARRVPSEGLRSEEGPAQGTRHNPHVPGSAWRCGATRPRCLPEHMVRTWPAHARPTQGREHLGGPEWSLAALRHALSCCTWYLARGSLFSGHYKVELDIGVASRDAAALGQLCALSVFAGENGKV